MKKSPVETIDSDVLVIGGGIAGIWCAIRAKEEVDRVIIVDKGFVGKTSHSALSMGWIMTLLPVQELDTCLQDLVQASDCLIDRELSGYILENSFERIKDMERWGVEYLKNGNEYISIPCRGAKYLRELMAYPGGGGATRLLEREALRRKVRIINRTYISNLLTHEGQVMGAAGIDTRSGELKIFRAKATILATNTVGFRGHYMGADMVGEGATLAYLNGAEIINSEFNRMHPQSPYYTFEGIGPAAIWGAKFRNAKGEAFMTKYEPELGDKADVGIIAKAMALEYSAGKGPLYFDFTGAAGKLSETNRLLRPNWRHLHESKLAKEGMDMLKPEWMPGYFYGLGGIKTNLDGASNVPGLWAAGKVRSFCISYMTGWSWASCIGTGYLAGKSAGEHARASRQGKIDSSQVEEFKTKLFEPLERKGKVTPDGLLEKIQEAVFPYDVIILKSEDKLKKALSRIEKLRDDTSRQMVAKDVHELIKLKETESILLNAEMVLRASLARTESRGAHYRTDFPDKDDANWLKWVVIKRGKGGEMTLRTEPLPMDRYCLNRSAA